LRQHLPVASAAQVDSVRVTAEQAKTPTSIRGKRQQLIFALDSVEFRAEHARGRNPIQAH
jgi:hypothetical protein